MNNDDYNDAGTYYPWSFTTDNTGGIYSYNFITDFEYGCGASSGKGNNVYPFNFSLVPPDPDGSGYGFGTFTAGGYDTRKIQIFGTSYSNYSLTQSVGGSNFGQEETDPRVFWKKEYRKPMEKALEDILNEKA